MLEAMGVTEDDEDWKFVKEHWAWDSVGDQGQEGGQETAGESKAAGEGAAALHVEDDGGMNEPASPLEVEVEVVEAKVQLTAEEQVKQLQVRLKTTLWFERKLIRSP